MEGRIIGTKFYNTLKSVDKKKYRQDARDGADEGGCAPACRITTRRSACLRSTVGSPATMAASMAVCRTGAAANQLLLYKHLARLGSKPCDVYFGRCPPST